MDLYEYWDIKVQDVRGAIQFAAKESQQAERRKIAQATSLSSAEIAYLAEG